MPCIAYHSSPIGRSAGSVRRPRVYTGGCSSRSSVSGISSRWRRARTSSWSASASPYGIRPSWATQSSSAIPALEVAPDRGEELRRQRAVERAVVPGHAQVGHRPDGDAIPADHHGPLHDRLEVEDRHLRLGGDGGGG